LIAHVMGKPRAWVLANYESELTSLELSALEEGVARLERGIPLPYVLGHWEFYGLDFQVTEAVLIPRPETELLVQTALEWLRMHPTRRRAVDIGTGSGCIAITLSVHIRRLLVYAGDISYPALSIARKNAEFHNVDEQVCLYQGTLGYCLGKPVDLICANLPYIPISTLKRLAVYRREPTIALSGGRDGLRLVRRLLEDAPRLLAPGGMLLAEIEERQGKSTGELARKAFPAGRVEVMQDLAGRDRLLKVET